MSAIAKQEINELRQKAASALSVEWTLKKSMVKLDVALFMFIISSPSPL